MTAGYDLDVAAVIDHGPIRGIRFGVFFLCALCLVIDGFGAQALNVIAPALMRDLAMTVATFGMISLASAVGLFAGVLLFSVVSDTLGRRPVIIGCIAFFAIGMMAMSLATSVYHLLLLRFVTGLALGGLMPGAVALVSEYWPRHARATVVMLLACCMLIGTALGSLLPAAVMTMYGWRSVCLFGGAAILIMAGLILLWLPKSPLFLVAQRKNAPRLRTLLQQLDPALQIGDQTRFVLMNEPGGGIPVAHLFNGGRAGGTLLIWIAHIFLLASLYLLFSWLPMIMTTAGSTYANAGLAIAILQAGGFVGMLLLGWIIDRVGFARVLAPGFFLAAIAIALIGKVMAAPPLMLVAIFVCGTFILGGQAALTALAARYYPTAGRATGIGWSQGIGRVGSTLAPALAGILVDRGGSPSIVLTIAAVAVVLSALTLLLFGWVADGGSPTMH